jgi:hypothetical protein
MLLDEDESKDDDRAEDRQEKKQLQRQDEPGARSSAARAGRSVRRCLRLTQKPFLRVDGRT